MREIDQTLTPPLPVYRERRRRAAEIVGFTVIALLAFTAVLLATRWGVATSSDSARYIRSARHVLGRETETASPIESPAEQAHFPPLYSTTLAVLSLGGGDPLTAARWLGAFLLAANALLAGEWVRRATGSTIASLFTAALVAFSPSSILIHTYALSEPLFLFLALLSLACLSATIERTRWKMLIAAALLAGLGVLTRYAGWAMVGTGCVALLILPRFSWKQRIGLAVAFAAIAALPPLGWSIRNALVLGSATNRVIAVHFVGATHIRDAARTARDWFFTDQQVHPALTGLAALLAIGVFVGGACVALRFRDEPRGRLAALMSLFIAATAALLVVSISLVDYHTPVDYRILSPIYVAGTVLLGATLAEGSLRRRDIRIAAWSVSLLLAAWAGVRSVQLINEYHRDGGGFAHRIWRESPTLAALRDVPQDKWIYTNAPGTVYLLTGRAVIITIPSEFSASSTLANPDYPAEMARTSDDLRSGRAVLVYLRRYGAKRVNYPTEEQLKQKLGLHRVGRFNDGTIFDFVAGAATTTSPSD